jgi:hypothetical protein
MSGGGDKEGEVIRGGFWERGQGGLKEANIPRLVEKGKVKTGYDGGVSLV